MVARQAYVASRAEPRAASVSNVEGLVLQFLEWDAAARAAAAGESPW